MSAVAPTPNLAQPKLRDIAPSVGHLSASQVVRRVLRFAILLVAARMLGVQTFGVYALLLTVVEMVAIVSGYGYIDFLTREVAKRPSSGGSLARKITLLRLLYVVPSLGIALGVLKAVGFSSAVILSTAYLGLTLVPRAAGEAAQGFIKGLRYFAPLLWIELVQGVIVLAGAATLLNLNFGLRGVIAAEIAGAFAGAIVAVWSVRGRSQNTTEGVPSLQTLVRSTFPFNIYPLIVNVYDRVDVVILSKLAGTFATGIYSMPYRAFSTIQIIPYGVMGALLPGLSSSKFDGAAEETSSRAMTFLYLISLLVILGAMAFARPLVLLALGETYASSVKTIQILVWAGVPAFLNFVLNTMLLATGREKVFLWTSTVCSVFNIGANLLLIPRFSFYGAAVVTVFTELLLFAQNCYFSKKYLGTVLLPKDGASSTIAFLVALAGFLLGKRQAGELWAGVLSFVAFGIFAMWTTGCFSKLKLLLVRRPA
jgi:O-antigen/teichoic acid export membrane protein